MTESHLCVELLKVFHIFGNFIILLETYKNLCIFKDFMEDHGQQNNEKIYLSSIKLLYILVIFIDLICNL